MTDDVPPTRAVAAVRAGAWPANRAQGRVTLPYDLRHRRRIRLTTDDGTAVLLDLEQATALADGDGLSLAGGGWIAVHAAPEPLLAVTAKDPDDLARLAWHVGNRHVPCQITAGRLLIRPDPVIADMLRGLGAAVRDVTAPFQPEGGAYRHGPDHHG